MKRLLFHASVLVGLGITGCAASPSSELPHMANRDTDVGSVAVVRRIELAERKEPAATASMAVTAAAYQDDDTIEALPAVTPPTNPGPAPQAAGNVFLPPPEIPAAPSVTWQAAPSLSGAAPLSLDELEAVACQNNPTLLQARAQIEGTLGKAIQAGLWPNPTVMYVAEQIGVKGTAGEFQGGIVRQRIVAAHKLDLSRQKFLARTRTAEWLALAQQDRVLNDIRIHYFRTRGRQELVDVQQQLLKNSEDNVVTFREMYNVGQATRAEVHQANVLLQQQRLNLLMAENDRQQSIQELTALAGVPLAVKELATPLEGEVSLIDWDDALQRLLQESPEVAAARSKLEADRLTIRREIAEPVPDLIIEGGAGYNFDALETVGTASVSMEVPVFDWNQGTIRQAEADYARQQGELQRTELVLRQRLAQQYRNYLTAVQHVRNYREVILPEARQAYDLRLKSYETDRAPWTDVLSAERDYFVHRSQYIENLIAWRENEVSILGFLLHGGLNAPTNPTPPGHIDAVPQPR